MARGPADRDEMRLGRERSTRAAQGRLFSNAKGLPEGTLEGEVVRVTFENHDTSFRVIRVLVDGDVERTLVGVFPPAPPGARIRATGKMMRDERRGDQFKVETLLTLSPATLAGIERFLASGIIPGIGPAYAKRIVTAFGEHTLEVLDKEPERLAEVEGLGGKRRAQVEKGWETHRAIGAIMIFLQTHGASPALASRIYKRFGARAVQIVSAQPYRLAFDVWGVGFRTADRIAETLGVARDAPERAQAGVLHTLHESASRGHTYVELTTLAAHSAEMLGVDVVRAEEAIASLVASERVIREDLGDSVGIFSLDLHAAETHVAEGIRALLSQPAAGRPLGALAADAIRSFEERAKVPLAPRQREAIELVAKSKVAIVTGGPGVGKTTIVRALLQLFDRGGLGTRLTAPTGRAAKRLSEATGREAVTMHRLLEFDPRARTFKHDEERPIDAGAIIVDEASMIDIALMDALISATPRAARIVFVGDVDQLPSVGPGAVLRDLIASAEIPTVMLTTIFRQASGSHIVENAHRIHQGEMPVGDKGDDGEFYLIERAGDEAAADAVVELVTTRIPKRFGLDPVADLQVLTPMHRGKSGTIEMNERLQSLLNPKGPEVKMGQKTLRLGDKVMQLRNDYEREVYNGDVGRIVRVDDAEKTLSVKFDDREVVYREPDLDELALAYATSIHKSQGSEYACVVIPLTMNHFVMLSRNLLYTGVTRGKRLVCLVADPRAVALSLAEIRKEHRFTRLADRIKRIAFV